MNAKVYLQYLKEHGKQASLSTILDAKEERVRRQQEYLCQGETLLCFTLNVPGACKRCELFDKGFQRGCELILQQLSWHRVAIKKQEIVCSGAGCELYVLCDADSLRIKRLMLQIEENDDFGRLLDIDVLRNDGSKISRSDVGMEPRRCLLCEEAAAVCGRSRAHSYEDLLLKLIDVLQEYFADEFLDRVASNAARALLYEVAASPKPGLVDRCNSGSHRDMDFFTFIDSAAVLAPYFRGFAQQGRELAEQPVEQILPQLRYPGRLAEEQMKKITHGVNCHKGIIFSLGVICCALGMRYEQGKAFNVHETLQLSKEICAALLDDFKSITEPHSYGERLYIQYGIKGIRGEAAEGYPSVENVALPALRNYLKQGLSLNDAGAWTLLELLVVTEDSNILARSDIETLRMVQKQAQDLLNAPERSMDLLNDLDRRFIQQNLSPGGCADLLALTYFLHFMDE